MRTSFNTSYRNALADVQRSAERLAEAQRQVSSGKRIGLPSDDPSGAQAIIGEYTVGSNIDQYIRATDSVDSRLSVADTVISDIVARITEVRSKLTSAQGSTLSATQRDALVGEITGIRDALYTDINTMFRGTYLFSGTASTAAPYTKDALGTVSSYQGNTSAMAVDLSEQTSVEVTFDGSAMTQGSAANDLFATMANLIAGVEADDKTAIATAASELSDHFDRAIEAQSAVGASQSQLDDQRTRLSAMKLASDARRESEEQTNYAEAITKMNQADTAYKAALGATGRIGQVSLLDYLK